MLLNKNIIYIGNKLANKGYTPTNIDTLGPQLEGIGFKIIYSSSIKNIFFRMLDMVVTIIANRKNAGVVLIDTYSTNAFYFAWICCRVCFFLNLPYIPILHGGNLPERLKNYPKLSSQIFNLSACNIFISDYLKIALQEHINNYKIIQNNIHIKQYNFKLRGAIKPNILWVRSFHKIYNPAMAVYMMAKLKEIYPDAKLTMIGPDKDGSMNLCKALAGELNVLKNIEFTGKLRKEDWLNLSKKYDIFINTTNFDNQPVSIIEAHALGLPIVSTNPGGIPYLITNNENGILVGNNDVDNMVAGIKKYLENPDFTSYISRNARQSAENFDWGIICNKWKELLTPFLN